MKTPKLGAESEANIVWHQLPAEEVVQLLGADLHAGLTTEEVLRRQEKFGPNRLTLKKGRSEWLRFLLQFHAPLLYILLAASVVTAVLGEWVDSSVIFAVVFLNAVVGYIQEARAEKAISALAQMVITAATVRRAGRKQRVPSEELVPGDIVLLESGDKVPADLRVFHVRNLQVDESALTGESVPVEKHGDALAPETLLAERRNLAFAGTLVTYGRAEGVVSATGDKTEMGRIAWLISEETADLSTPLTRKIAHFSKLILWAILALAVATFALGTWRGENPVEMFMAAVALAVGAIPEGLPAAVTITLAIGVSRMARRRAIICSATTRNSSVKKSDGPYRAIRPKPRLSSPRKRQASRMPNSTSCCLGWTSSRSSPSISSWPRFTAEARPGTSFTKRVPSNVCSTAARRRVAEGLTFLGLQGMIDPPRPEAIEAVRQCRAAGIAVKMITGDHLLTAAAIARTIGLEGAADRFAVSGRELEKLSDEELSGVVESAAVFARVAPEQKLWLVRALQARGHVVAMTGDGVNDAPALKQSDIGVAMGITGTDVAKGAADMILTDDNFASVVAAVEEGRNVFDNLTKFIVWTLPTNAGEGLVILSSIVVGAALPALPVQMLWINMTTALLLGLMLVFEPKEHDLMQRPPRDPKEQILTFPLFMRTGLVTLIILAGAFGLFLWEQACGATLAEARTIVVNVIVVVEIFYLLNCRSLTHSMRSLGLFSNPWMLFGAAAMLAAQFLFTYAPFMNHLFHTAPLPAEAWLHIFAVGLVAFTAVGTEKWIRVRVERRPI